MNKLLLAISLALALTSGAHAVQTSYFYTPYGNIAGSAVSVPGVTWFYDQNYTPIGTAVSTDPRVTPKGGPLPVPSYLQPEKPSRTSTIWGEVEDDEK